MIVINQIRAILWRAYKRLNFIALHANSSSPQQAMSLHDHFSNIIIIFTSYIHGPVICK